MCRSGIGLWHLLQAGRRPCSSDPLSRASCPAAQPAGTHAQGVSLQSAGPGRLRRTVLSAAGQASRGYRSLFTPLEVRLARGPPPQQARGPWGKQAGASPLRFTQFQSLNNWTEETRHDWSVWCERRLAAANESSKCAHAYRILPPAARPPVTCTRPGGLRWPWRRSAAGRGVLMTSLADHAHDRFCQHSTGEGWAAPLSLH